MDNSGGYVTLDISNGGGGTWVELDRFQGPGNNSSYQPANYGISAHIGPNTRIRFLGSPNLGSTDRVYFDDLAISVSGCSGS